MTLSLDEGTLGSILVCASDVRWSSQSGGELCLQPAVEGLFLPWPRFVDRGGRDPMLGYAGAYDADLVARWLLWWGFSSDLRPLTADEQENLPVFGARAFSGPAYEEQIECGLLEGWVPAVILPRSPSDVRIVQPFVGKVVILVTWNSD